MKIPKSKFGISLVAIYLIFTAISWVYALTCNGMFCGLVVVLPVMPWAILLEGIVGDSWYVYVVLAIINLFILYFIGRGLGILFDKVFHKSQMA